MSAPYTEIINRKIIDYDDVINTQLLQPNTTGNVITSWQVKPRRHIVMPAFRQAWDAAGNGFLTYHLLINGTPIYPYDSKTVSLGSPYEDIYLPKPLEIPQAAIISVTADLGNAAAAVNFTSRSIFWYFELENQLNHGHK